MKTSPTKGRSAAGLTATQIILLNHAIAGPIEMMRGDRMGTRCVGYDEATGAALIVAYSNPEMFLVRRGLLRTSNARHSYHITDAGRAAIARAKAALGGAA